MGLQEDIQPNVILLSTPLYYYFFLASSASFLSSPLLSSISILLFHLRRFPFLSFPASPSRPLPIFPRQRFLAVAPSSGILHFALTLHLPPTMTFTFLHLHLPLPFVSFWFSLLSSSSSFHSYSSCRSGSHLSLCSPPPSTNHSLNAQGGRALSIPLRETRKPVSLGGMRGRKKKGE